MNRKSKLIKMLSMILSFPCLVNSNISAGRGSESVIGTSSMNTGNLKCVKDMSKGDNRHQNIKELSNSIKRCQIIKNQNNYQRWKDDKLFVRDFLIYLENYLRDNVNIGEFQILRQFWLNFVNKIRSSAYLDNIFYMEGKRIIVIRQSHTKNELYIMLEPTSAGGCVVLGNSDDRDDKYPLLIDPSRSKSIFDIVEFKMYDSKMGKKQKENFKEPGRLKTREVHNNWYTVPDMDIIEEENEENGEDNIVERIVHSGKNNNLVSVHNTWPKLGMSKSRYRVSGSQMRHLKDISGGFTKKDERFSKIFPYNGVDTKLVRWRLKKPEFSKEQFEDFKRGGDLKINFQNEPGKRKLQQLRKEKKSELEKNANTYPSISKINPIISDITRPLKPDFNDKEQQYNTFPRSYENKIREIYINRNETNKKNDNTRNIKKISELNRPYARPIITSGRGKINITESRNVNQKTDSENINKEASSIPKKTDTNSKKVFSSVYNKPKLCSNKKDQGQVVGQYGIYNKFEPKTAVIKYNSYEQNKNISSSLPEKDKLQSFVSLPGEHEDNSHRKNNNDMFNDDKLNQQTNEKKEQPKKKYTIRVIDNDKLRILKNKQNDNKKSIRTSGVDHKKTYAKIDLNRNQLLSDQKNTTNTGVERQQYVKREIPKKRGLEGCEIKSNEENIIDSIGQVKSTTKNYNDQNKFCVVTVNPKLDPSKNYNNYNDCSLSNRSTQVLENDDVHVNMQKVDLNKLVKALISARQNKGVNNSTNEISESDDRNRKIGKVSD